MQLKTSTLASLFMIMLLTRPAESSESVEPSKSLEKVGGPETLVPASGLEAPSPQTGASAETPPPPEVDRIPRKSLEFDLFQDAVKGNISRGLVFFLPRVKDANERRDCLRLLITLGTAKFVRVLQQAFGNDKELILEALRVVFTYADEEFRKSFLKYVNFDDELLRLVTYDADLACNPEGFVALLNKISTVNSQIIAIQHGVMKLAAAKRIECFNPLLSRLEDEKSLNWKLVDAAIASAFLGDYRPIDNEASLTRLYVDHPAVSPRDYAIALYNSSCGSDSTAKDARFYWLLARADPMDLKKILNNQQYFSLMMPNHQDAVRDAIASVGSRDRPAERRKERNSEVQKIFKKLPEDPISIIGAYDD